MASASTASARVPDTAACTVARSYSFTQVMSARVWFGTAATGRACGPSRSTMHGVSMMSSSSQERQDAAVADVQRMTAPVLPAIAEIVISAMLS